MVSKSPVDWVQSAIQSCLIRHSKNDHLKHNSNLQNNINLTNSDIAKNENNHLFGIKLYSDRNKYLTMKKNKFNKPKQYHSKFIV